MLFCMQNDKTDFDKAPLLVKSALGVLNDLGVIYDQHTHHHVALVFISSPILLSFASF